MHIIKLWLRIGGWIFISISVIDLTITFFIYRHEHSFVESASRAQATITKMVQLPGSNYDTAYYPVFTFQDAKGQWHEISSSSGQYPPAYKVGDMVTVLYSPDAPSNAKLDSFFDIWFLSVMFGCSGLFELVMGLGFLLIVFIIRRHERKLSMTPNTALEPTPTAP